MSGSWEKDARGGCPCLDRRVMDTICAMRHACLPLFLPQIIHTSVPTRPSWTCCSVRQVGAVVVVDVRSASRVGKGDLGCNAARIDRYLAALRAELGL